MKFHCNKCKSPIISSSCNAGEIIKETGAFPILVNEGGLIWICANCYQELAPKIQEAAVIINSIRKMVNCDSIHIPSLVSKE